MRIDLESRGFQAAAWIGIALLVAAGVYLAVVGRWNGAWTMAGFAIGSVLLVLARDRLPDAFSFLFVLAALINAAGWVWNLYQRLAYYDEVAHGLTMCVIGLVIGFFVHYARRGDRTRPGAVFVVVTTLAALAVGAAWEGVEWVFGIIGTTWDTFMDLLLDGLGGVLAGALAARLIRRNPPSQLRDDRGSAPKPVREPAPRAAWAQHAE